MENSTKHELRKSARSTAAPMRVLRRTCISLAWFLMFIAGYILSYQIFFVETPLTQVTSSVTGDVSRKDFRFYQVVYFRGYELTPGQELKLDVSTPKITAFGSPSVEFFVETEGARDAPGGAGTGKLQIDGLGTKTYVYTLKPERHQRFTVPWTNKLGERNRDVRIRYLGNEITAGGTSSTPIIVATNIVGFSLWPYILVFMICGVALLFFAPSPDQTKLDWSWRQNIWQLSLFGTALLLFCIHSGGFASHVLFEGHGTIGDACKRMGPLLQSGQWAKAIQIDPGVGILPIIAAAIDLAPLLPLFSEDSMTRINPDACNIYPTAGYLIYALWLAGVLSFMNALRTIWSPGLAFVFAGVSATYFPFLIHIFSPDSDTFFIVLFAFYLTLVLRLLSDIGTFRVNAGLIVLLTFFLGLSNMTPVFLSVLLPVTLLLKEWKSRRSQAILRCAAGVALLMFSFLAGSVVADQFQNPRPVSETAREQAQPRGYRFGFYQSRQSSRSLERVLSRERTEAEVISGKLRSKVEHAVSLIRYGEGWKVAPLVFMGKITQDPLVRPFDFLVILPALIGILIAGSLPLGFFLAMTALAQFFIFAVGWSGAPFTFPDADRYFILFSWVLLFGLSKMLYEIGRAVNRVKI